MFSGIRKGSVLVRSFRGRRGMFVAAACLFIIIAATGASCGVRSGGEWTLSAYGVNTRSEKVSYAGGYDARSVTIDNSGSGKMVTYGADGIAFYHTELDAMKDNFTLSATVVVNSWTMTNGEDDGFGLMACDAVGKDGDSADFWNNSYMATVTKVEYDWNPEREAVSNVGDHIVMRQGIAAREKVGSSVSYPDDPMAAAAAQTVTTCTLESSQGRCGPGTYNIIGNFTPIIAAGLAHAPAGTVDAAQLLTELKMEISRDNTGYRIRYTEEDGTVHEKLFCDEDRSSLSVIDPEKVYVGFFVANQASVTFRDIKLVVTGAEKDPEPEERAPELIDPDFRVTSSSTANTDSYELVFETNYAGVLSVGDELGNSIASGIILEAGESVSIPCALHPGENLYEIMFVPDAEKDGPSVLSDPSAAVFTHSVSYRKIGDGQGNIYTVPGCGDGDGTKKNPISLVQAVKYAAPGQTIFLSGGIYAMTEPLDIERGHDGEAGRPIVLMSDPDSGERPVLDFQGRSAGIVLSANHWHLYGFDVTGSGVNEYGIHLTGNSNTLERLEIYRNGNTGLHISSLSLWDDIEQWPSNNYILNCTSYGNCDDAYEDADGFACQFTAGPGNVFDGCIAYHNADDGWDLYAKVWLEPLGPVVIRNCVAYRNGYLEDGTEAGNGNGFKLGGDSMPGGHIVEGCLSFENKASGFTSNSCPDVTLQNCTAIDNGTRNIDLSTRNQKDTAYVARNIRSLRTEATLAAAGDRLKGSGSQAEEDLHNASVYFWDPEKRASINSAGDRIAAQELYASTQFTEGYSIVRDQDGGIVFQGDFLRALAPVT